MSLINRMIEFFFPEEYCPLCEVESSGLCRRCESTLRYFGSFKEKEINGTAILNYSMGGERLIYRFKKERRFSAMRALFKVEEDFLRSNKDLYKYVKYIFYIPSSERMKKIRGFDPGFLLARRIGEILKIEVHNIFINTSLKENKNLTSEERLINIEKHLNLKKLKKDDFTLEEKDEVILYDDIITSGASMGRALMLLNNCLYIPTHKIKVLTLFKG